MAPQFTLDDPDTATPDLFDLGGDFNVGPFKSSDGSTLPDGSINGSPNDGYTRRALMLSGQEAKSEDNAMTYLRQSLNKSQDLTPSQGIAAAILAAVPTFGGYLIGQRVGRPTIDPSLYGTKGIEDSVKGLGGAAGGAIGAQTGAAIADDYLKGLKVDNSAIYQKMADAESKKAERLGTEANTVTNAGLAAQNQRDLLPLQFANQEALQNNSSANSLSNEQKMEVARSADAKSLVDYKSNTENQDFSDEAQTALAKIQTRQPLSQDDADALAADPKALRLSIDLQKSNTQEKNVGAKSNIPPKIVSDVVGPAIIGKDLSQSLGELQSTLGDDPSLLDKSFAQFPLGNPAHDAMQELIVNGARSAKNLEGRVNKSTLDLYTDLVTSAPTEPLSSVIRRGQRFIQALNDDTKYKVGSMKAAGSDTGDLENYLTSNFGMDFGQSSSSGSTSVPGETKQQFIDRRTREIMAGG